MRSRAFARTLAAWLLAALTCIAAGSAQAQAVAPAGCDVMHDITNALRVVAQADDATPPSTETVAIPDHLSLALRSERVHIRYEVDVSACAQSPSPALWVFRAGAPYRITAGGVPLALMSANAMAATGAGSKLRARGSGVGVYNGRIPALFALPPGERTVSIEFQTLPYLPSGIVQLSMGPTNLLLPRHTASVRSVVGYADAASGVVLVVALISLLLWLPRRRDLNLLWMALACGLWGVRGLIYFNNTVPGNPLLFEQLNPINALLAAAATAAAALHLLRAPGDRRIGTLATLTGLCLVGFVLAQLAGQGAAVARTAAQLLGTGFICWLGFEAWQRRGKLAVRHTVLILGCVAAVLACVIHDLLVVAGARSPASDSWVFWGFVIVLIGFALMSGEYVVATLNRAERSNEELALHVARKTQELEHSYERLRSSEQDAVRAQERERLLRDMHDGLGAHLMTALRGVERGALAPAQVAQSLQDSLDELRMLMDSTDMGHYLPGALAAWRNRWDARLSAAGVTLDWRIDESLDGVQLTSETAMQVMRILQEAATNVVKHSKAQHMSLAARVEGQGNVRTLLIEIDDDGVGLSDEAVQSGARGLKNMAYRAQQIGGELVVTSRDPAGCRVCLTLSLRA